jgi:hypothetical protein
MSSSLSLSLGRAPGTRCGPSDPTAPALRASLRCSLQAGSAQTRFAQTRAALYPPEAALLSGAQGIARPAPPAGLGVAQSLRSPARDAQRSRPRWWAVGLWAAVRLRRAPQRKADQGRACLSEASLRGPRLSRGAAAKSEGPQSSAARRPTARRRTYQTKKSSLPQTPPRMPLHQRHERFRRR